MSAIDEETLLDHNIVVVTVDSCRFDTAQRARTPVLDGIGDLRTAETYGSFTLPAHAAIFTAVHYCDLPSLFGERYAGLPELGRVAAVKVKTRAAIARIGRAVDGNI